jgi:hypothetical protein
MRLRQLALMANKIAPVKEDLEAVFGLKVGFVDDGVEFFGLKNVVMPAGGEFIEVLEPFRDDASGARYLKRRGGDAGYMVILQDADAMAHRARLEAMGVRLIAKSRGEDYQYTHFHPGDCAGVLLSIDSVPGDADWTETMSPWPPAGPDWRKHESDVTLGILGASIQHRDPAAAAARFSELLALPAMEAEGTYQILLDRAFLKFVPPVDADGTGVVAIDLLVDDKDTVLERARARGLPLHGDAVTIGGVSFKAVAAE